MPHVIVKLHPGRSEDQKSHIADEVTKTIVATAKCGADAVSVTIEEVAAKDWVEAVYKPDIKEKWDSVYKKPGYDPL